MGINNPAPIGSAFIDMGRKDQGLLINRVSIKGTNDATTILGAEPDGLLVYNTATAGTGDGAVKPGFYFWKGSRWNGLV